MADGTSGLRPISQDMPSGSAQAAGRSATAFVAPVLLTDEQAAAALGVSVRKFHELRAQPWLPAPVVLGPRLLRWPRAELEAAVAEMPRQREATEPAALARARIDRLTKGAPR